MPKNAPNPRVSVSTLAEKPRCRKTVKSTIGSFFCVISQIMKAAKPIAAMIASVMM